MAADVVKLRATRSDSAPWWPETPRCRETTHLLPQFRLEVGVQGCPPPKAVAEILAQRQGTLYQDWGFSKRC